MTCAFQTTVRTGRVWSKLSDTNNIYEQIYRKHFIKQYAGKATKRYMKLCEKLREAGNVFYEINICELSFPIKNLEKNFVS
jgi:hypothetical protein